MSIFFSKPQQCSPFFRFANELDRAVRLQQAGSVRSFTPRFDIQETEEAYELHGELPGIEQSNVNIEWSDDHTITISGKSEKHREVTNVKETPEVEEASSPDAQYQKPTVEDEDYENITKDGESDVEKPVEAKPTESTSAQAKATQPRVWMAERSYGSFSRTFQFLSRVEQDSVKASLKNGVLSITVPKAKLREPKRIVIN